MKSQVILSEQQYQNLTNEEKENLLSHNQED